IVLTQECKCQSKNVGGSWQGEPPHFKVLPRQATPSCGHPSASSASSALYSNRTAALAARMIAGSVVYTTSATNSVCPSPCKFRTDSNSSNATVSHRLQGNVTCTMFPP